MLGMTPAMGGSASVVVSPGVGLTVAAPAVGSFALVRLDGTARSAEADFGPFTVTDARGTGEGWTVTIEATPLRAWQGGGYVPGGPSLPRGSLTLPDLAVVADGTDSRAPTLVDGANIVDGSAVSVAHAEPDTGMGRYTFLPLGPLRVNVPATLTGVYRSEVSVAVISGP